MEKEWRTPDFVLATSWEVCNKVGGIYTVLSTQAKTLQTETKGNLVYIGPDFNQDGANVDFLPDENLHPEWREAAARKGVPCRIGRWDVPGLPAVALVDFTPLFSRKNDFLSVFKSDMDFTQLPFFELWGLDQTALLTISE